MTIIERNKVRKIFYSGYIIIMLLLIVILAGIFTTSLKNEYQIKIKQLQESLISFKKSYIKDNVGVLLQGIKIENEAFLKEMEYESNTVSQFILQYLNSMDGKQDKYNFSILNYLPMHTDYIVFDLTNKRIIITSRNFDYLKDSHNLEHIKNKIKSNPISSTLNDKLNRFFVGVGVSQQTIDAFVQKKIGDRIRKTKLLESGYIWVNKVVNYDGGENYATRLIHPNLPQTEGQFLSTFSTDIKGNLPYKEELEGIKNDGEVFLEYYFKKNGSDKIAHKLSYAKLYKPYDWVIATGVYLDDIDILLQNEKKRMQITYNNKITLTITLSIICFLLSGLIMFFFEAHLYKLLQRYTNTIRERESSLENEKLNALKAFQKADESEKKYSYLFQNMREAFALGEVIFDSQGVPIDFVYKNINKGFETILNIKRDYIIGKKITEVFPGIEQDSTEWLSIFGDVVKTGQSITIESYSELLKKWFYVNAYKIKDNQFAFIFMDISPMKEKEKLAGVLELSGAICHELSQPLQSVTGYSELLLLGIDETDSKFIKLNKLSFEIKRLSKIVQRLSHITRYETIEFPQGTIIDIKKSSDKNL